MAAWIMRPQPAILLCYLVMAISLLATGGSFGETPGDARESLIRQIETSGDHERPALLIELARHLCFEDSERAIELADEALDLAIRLDDLQAEADAHNIKGRAFLAMSRYADSLAEMQSAESLHRDLGNESDMAKCLGYQGMALSSMGEFWPAIEKVERALEIFRRTENLKGIAAATNNLGTSLERVGDYERALGLHLESLEIERSLERTIGIANNLNSIGNIHARLVNLEQARDHYEQALDLFEEINAEYGIVQCLNNIGNTYEDQDRNDQALEFFSRALEMAQRMGHPSLEANPLTNMGIVYKKTGDFDRSLEMYERAAKIEGDMGERADLAVSLQNIGELYLLMDEPDKALATLERSEAIAVETQSHAALVGTYRNLAEAHAQLGDFRRAHEYLLKHGEVRDASLAEDKQRTVAELQARYDADRRREEIALLTKDNEIQELELSRSRLTSILMVAVVILLLGVAVLLLRRYRSLLAFWKKKVFIGPYRIGDEISSGGMGVVYHATNVLDPGRTVALKVIRDEIAGDATQRRRFVNEGQIIDSINHPNIVTVYDRGEHNERLYIAMEYLAGQTLAEIIDTSADRGEILAEDRCLRFMSQLSDAVTSIHTMGIVHRDIKPNNVVVTGSGETTEGLKLLDFGTAKLDTMTTLTAAGELVGTIGYLAPERIRHHEPTAASDVFSLGVVFYELLTLTRPFPAEDPGALIRQILDMDPVEPSVRRSDVPDELNTLVMEMLNKDAHRRPDGEELMHRLTRLAAEAA